jgi:uncharacterized protein (TIGR02996 family)
MKTTREALEAAIAADFDDRAAHAAYADLLMEQGDPHGELIAVQLALEEPRPASERQRLAEREGELLGENGREWLGGLLQSFPLSRGWLESVHIGHATYRLTEQLAQAPLARFLRRLEIDFGYEDGWGYWDEERQEVLPPPPIPPGTPQENEYYLPLMDAPFLGTLRYFRIGQVIGDEGPFWMLRSSGRADLLAPILERTPRLEELHLLAHTRVGHWFDPTPIFRLPLPNLRVLRAYHLFDHATEALAANASLGRLTHLLFHSHADDPCSQQRGPYLTLTDLRNVLRSPHLRSLAHLQFRLSDVGDAGCAEIVRCGAVKRLKSLDLRHGRVTDEGARRLAACGDLHNLERLELSRNQLTSRGFRHLRRSGVSFTADGQHSAGDNHWLVEGDWE